VNPAQCSWQCDDLPCFDSAPIGTPHRWRKPESGRHWRSKPFQRTAYAFHALAVAANGPSFPLCLSILQANKKAGAEIRQAEWKTVMFQHVPHSASYTSDITMWTRLQLPHLNDCVECRVFSRFGRRLCPGTPHRFVSGPSRNATFYRWNRSVRIACSSANAISYSFIVRHISPSLPEK